MAPGAGGLPSFSESWIGGDIHGVDALGATLAGYVPQLADVVTALDGRADRLVGDAGWSGEAASRFAKHWEDCSLAATALGDAIGQTSAILRELAAELARVESALERAADEARGQGVPVGPDGRPPTGPAGPVAAGSPAANAQAAAQTYLAEWETATRLALGFRLDANAKLQTVLTLVRPAGSGSHGTVSAADATTLADYLRGVGAAKSGAVDLLSARLPKLQREFTQARADFVAARKAAAGKPMPADVKAARSAAYHNLQDLKTELAEAERAEDRVPLSKLLNTSVADMGKLLPGADEAVDGMMKGSKALKFLGDIPVIDVAAAGLGTYFQASSDIQKGQNPAAAVAEDATANLSGLLAGSLAAVGTGAAITAGAAALGVAAPAVAVAGAAAAVGGAVAVGVGDLAYEGFHEHWDEDIHKYGVLGGVGHGAVNTVKRTGKDLANLGSDIGHGAAGVWHSVFG
jgi:uncharacterized protein YukE